jgi:glyoxylase-like metal-dependent hydrolase (beta-lactamase superfamily II)
MSKCREPSIHVLELEMTKLGKPLMLRPVLIVDEDDVTLVDTAYPGQFVQLQEAIAVTGVPFNRLNRIIITHQDWDHVGLMKEIIESSGPIEIYAHSLEKPYLEGTLPYIKTTPEKIAARLQTIPAGTRDETARMFAAIPTFGVTQMVEDGQVLPLHGGIRIIHTPGHTPGHISLYIQAKRVLIPGDELRVDAGRLVGPAPEHTPDMALAMQSMPKLLDFDIDSVICFHGGLYETNVSEAIRQLASNWPPA